MVPLLVLAAAFATVAIDAQSLTEELRDASAACTGRTCRASKAHRPVAEHLLLQTKFQKQPMPISCADVWSNDAEGYTCGARIEWVTTNGDPACADCQNNIDASKAFIAGQFPDVCGVCGTVSTAAPSAAPPVSASCEDVWDTDADGFTCGQRIDWVIGHGDGACADCQNNADASRAFIAGQFPVACGVCGTASATTTTTATPATPAPTPSSPGPSPGGDGPYCGIAPSVYDCPESVAYLTGLDAKVGASFAEMCMGYGGTHPQTWNGQTDANRDMCSLNINNDCEAWVPCPTGWCCQQNYGISKDPRDCHGRYFFLWDEPQTQGKNARWAAQQWKRHVDAWDSEMQELRSRGTMVTSPLFTDHQGPAKTKFEEFFSECGSGCSTPGHKYYIDKLLTNQWVLNERSRHAGQEQWIINTMADVSAQWGGRKVILGNFAWLGATSAAEQIQVLESSKIWDRTQSGLEAVFYFCGVDYGGGTSNHELTAARSDGMTVGQALINVCRQYQG